MQNTLISCVKFSWTTLYRVTDDDGRASAFLTSNQFVSGYYKMRFGVGGYFSSKGMDTFFPFAEVVNYLLIFLLCFFDDLSRILEHRSGSLDCSSADFGPDLLANQLNNNTKIDFGAPKSGVS